LVSHSRKPVPLPELIATRLERCVELRDRLYDAPYYRLVYGEGDELPGLVIDRYGDVAVVQIATAGMERHKDAIVEALDATLKPAGILWQNSSPLRDLEGLERYVEVARGAVPDTVTVPEGDARFTAPLREGQKTGWFFDQRDNRLALRRFASGARVLDVCSYVGAWGVHAALAGAQAVTCLDASAPALRVAEANAAANGVALGTLRTDAFDGLRALRDDGAQFDLIVLDPPALIKRRKDRDEGTQAYRRLNDLALKLLAPDGVLVSCSCSHFMPADALCRLVQGAARRAGRFARLLSTGYQGADHPVHPAIAESRYLKALTFHVAGQ
ncbi:MAG: class I SAM-dependent rRNA methyltransferase, partial [Pseudomonadota bacterium]